MLGSRQCSMLQQHHMQVLVGVTISSGLPFAPWSEGREARAKCPHLGESLGAGRVSGQRPSSEPLTPFPSPAVPMAWAGIAGRTSGNRGPSFSPGAARAASLLFSQEAVHSAVPGRVDTACHTSVGGLKVAGNVAGIRSGALSSPSPSRGCQVWAYPLLLSLFGVPGDKAET